MVEICPDRMIVQADGIPMGGGDDDYRTTLQAVACADIVDKFSLPVHILLSGGTNSKSIQLSEIVLYHTQVYPSVHMQGILFMNI